MRTLVLVFTLFAAALTGTAVAQQSAPEGIRQLEWLQGTWQREALPPGRSGDEVWQREGDALVGVGSSYRDGVLRFREQLRIVQEGGEVFYVADVPDNPAPVKFRQTQQQGQSVIFENPAHDFPQRIAYQREGERLTARVSGGGREQVFHFLRSAQDAD